MSRWTASNEASASPQPDVRSVGDHLQLLVVELNPCHPKALATFGLHLPPARGIDHQLRAIPRSHATVAPFDASYCARCSSARANVSATRSNTTVWLADPAADERRDRPDVAVIDNSRNQTRPRCSATPRLHAHHAYHPVYGSAPRIVTGDRLVVRVAARGWPRRSHGERDSAGSPGHVRSDAISGSLIARDRALRNCLGSRARQQPPRRRRPVAHTGPPGRLQPRGTPENATARAKRQ